MTTQFLGEIRMFSFNFAPKGWAFCNGQTVAISANTALFSLIGTFYGGNGTTNFNLPNLQSTLALHQGIGAGLSPYTIGQSGGVENVTLTASEIPPHAHTFNATTASATSGTIGSTLVPATPTATGATAYAVSQASDPGLVAQTFAAGAVATAGGSQPHSNVMPLLCLTFCIALVGIFPSRN